MDCLFKTQARLPIRTFWCSSFKFLGTEILQAFYYTCIHSIGWLSAPPKSHFLTRKWAFKNSPSFLTGEKKADPCVGIPCGMKEKLIPKGCFAIVFHPHIGLGQNNLFFFTFFSLRLRLSFRVKTFFPSSC